MTNRITEPPQLRTRAETKTETAIDRAKIQSILPLTILLFLNCATIGYAVYIHRSLTARSEELRRIDQAAHSQMTDNLSQQIAALKNESAHLQTELQTSKNSEENNSVEELWKEISKSSEWIHHFEATNKQTLLTIKTLDDRLIRLELQMADLNQPPPSGQPTQTIHNQPNDAPAPPALAVAPTNPYPELELPAWETREPSETSDRRKENTRKLRSTGILTDKK
jgi:hypothetical protein